MTERHTVERPAPPGVAEGAPVVLSRLTKGFKSGVIAVDGLSLTVEHGQVFGLLGPNGSGKTTTLRMLVGLVRPSSGNAYLFGEKMVAGHPVLRRVGTLVERPAFLSYLSGRKNLELFWRAGGQHLGAANLKEALKVAGLGDAIERKVGTYSKGMVQRLGLARVVLKDPELLILDEPTVGLDPQEMREIRQLIREVAERGSTVILSSHILAEVEQVCTHVAVIDHGRLIASGAVAELTRAGSSVYIEVDDVERAVAILGCLDGVVEVSREAPGLGVRLDGVEREAIVSTLVKEGIGVGTVSSRYRLEDAFLQILAEEQQ